MTTGRIDDRKDSLLRRMGFCFLVCLLASAAPAGCALMQPPDARTEAVRLYHYQGLRDELIVETPRLSPATAKPGSHVTREVSYTLLSPQQEKKFQVTETVSLSGNDLLVELSKQAGEKAQGAHASKIEITVPRDLPPGTYTVITRISTEEQQVTKKNEFQVVR